ncbi:hypothetical protein XENTR_v10023182 [Xenopus tropicalis]|nr:hypothetical protein XENTR_v10023182 [Xenopus tropicalis]
MFCTTFPAHCPFPVTHRGETSNCIYRKQRVKGNGPYMGRFKLQIQVLQTLCMDPPTNIWPKISHMSMGGLALSVRLTTALAH